MLDYWNEKVKTAGMDTKTQTQPGPHEVYYDDGVSRYFIATAAAWESLQRGEHTDADGLNNYSLWCSSCAGSDVGSPDGYDDEAAAIAVAARPDAGEGAR